MLLTNRRLQNQLIIFHTRQGDLSFAYVLDLRLLLGLLIKRGQLFIASLQFNEETVATTSS